MSKQKEQVTTRSVSRVILPWVLSALLGMSLVAPASFSATRFDGDPIKVIVQDVDSASAREAVRLVGGDVYMDLPIVRGVAATIPSDALDTLENMVAQVTPDAAIVFQDYRHRKKCRGKSGRALRRCKRRVHAAATDGNPDGGGTDTGGGTDGDGGTGGGGTGGGDNTGGETPTPDVTPTPGTTAAPDASPTPGSSPGPGSTPLPDVSISPGATPTPGVTITPGSTPSPGGTATPGPSPTTDPKPSPEPTETPGPAANAPQRIQRVVRASALWKEGVTGKGVTVAVLDTGIYGAHPDLKGRVLECVDFSGEFQTAAASPTPSPSATLPSNGGGTVPTSGPQPTATVSPTSLPTALPSVSPSISPLPTLSPSVNPTAIPTALPSVTPSVLPSVTATAIPTSLPSVLPTAIPTATPTIAVTATPTVSVSSTPTVSVSSTPTVSASVSATPITVPSVSVPVTPVSTPTLASTPSPVVTAPPLSTGGVGLGARVATSDVEGPGARMGCTDTFGHGTFMAGLIAGDGSASDGKYSGVAPKANLVAVKASGFDGSTDISKILAGIQWVVANKNVYDIRVLNLSLGSDSTQDYRLSPLNFAVEKAWQEGIVVVVSAGNSGPDAKTVMKPGDDPFVITVGSSNDEGTIKVGDDRVPVFSSRGTTRSNGLAKPDVVSPGVHTISLRSPGSGIDVQFGDQARVDNNYFRGSGTSMSTATVSGIVALMLQKRPNLTPDQVKFRLLATARKIADKDPVDAGNGIVDAYAATNTSMTGEANQGLEPSTGLGSISADRGTIEADAATPMGSVALTGELIAMSPADADPADPLSLIPWIGASYTTTGWDASSWSGTKWKTEEWAGTKWKGEIWESTTWDGTKWKGTKWKNADWEGTKWKNADWNGTKWKSTNWKSAWYGVAWD